LIRPDAYKFRKAAEPRSVSTRFLAPRDIVPRSGAAAVSCPAVPDPTWAV
jgi:hypothetical protein